MTEMLNELRPGLSKQDETELLQVYMFVCLYDATEADTLIFFTLTQSTLCSAHAACKTVLHCRYFRYHVVIKEFWKC